MNHSPLILFLLILFCSCGTTEKERPMPGTWHAEMQVKDGKILPFEFKLSREEDKYEMLVTNAEEEVIIDDIVLTEDSITIRMPVYEGYITGIFTAEKISGNYIKESLDRRVPFEAKRGDYDRFTPSAEAETDISGIWEAEFSKDTEDAYPAKGIFEQKGNKVRGTFRTNKGDYRYLDGIVDGDSLKLSTFDGAHAFLFLASIKDSTMNGVFYSDNHFKEPFVAVRNEGFELSDADQLTFLREGYDKLEFSFPDGEGKLVSLEDPEFRDKVVLVQIMGTWCPNCMDETKFLVAYLDNNDHADLRVVALAFEYAKTQEAAFAGIDRLKNRVGVKYPVLLAQYGTSNKVKANEKLPMLNHVLSYPTTIFIDKKGDVRRIHTGFNGPATGEKYLEFKEDFEAYISSLLSE